jgi:hypothetical protein
MPNNNETGRGARFNAIKDLIGDNLKLRFQALNIGKPALKDEEKFVTLQVGKTVWEQVRIPWMQMGSKVDLETASISGDSLC